jgi:hypothetical protein
MLCDVSYVNMIEFSIRMELRLGELVVESLRLIDVKDARTLPSN